MRKKMSGMRRQKITTKPVIATAGKLKGHRVYKKAGKLHSVSYRRDKMVKAEHNRKSSAPTYTGDVKGSRI